MEWTPSSPLLSSNLFRGGQLLFNKQQRFTALLFVKNNGNSAVIYENLKQPD